MKKHLLVISALSLILILAACSKAEVFTFRATILEILDGYFLVESIEEIDGVRIGDEVVVSRENMAPSPEPKVGDVLEIKYDGTILLTYPGRIYNVYSIRVVEQ